MPPAVAAPATATPATTHTHHSGGRVFDHFIGEVAVGPFMPEFYRRVRDAIGPGKALGLRICVDDFIKPAQGGLGPDKLRQIAAEYRHWYQHSHPPGGDAFASVPKCKLVDA